MVELLVKYIQDKGYIVDVLPHTLVIRKEAKGQLFSLSWGIHSSDMRPDFEEVLYYAATRKLMELEEAIAQYRYLP